MSEDIERLHDSILGETDQLIEIANGSMLTALSSRMAEQSSRYIDIVSRHLDPPAYDNDQFVAAVKRLALSSKHARIRIMIIDARPLITTGHRLIELASRLPSFIEIRAPGRQHRGFNEAILLVDNLAYIHRQFSDHFEGQANFSDRRVGASLRERINDMWARGVPETRFRRLHI
ncbi:MAG: acyltransferase [Gammaproteobacteria bacterium]